MSIEKLRTEVRRLCDLVIRYVSIEDAQIYCLSTNSPANTMENYEVNILNCITEANKVQAEAHELGHIYIREKGLVSIELQECGPFDYLALELNNALSHRFVIDTLLKKFSIYSDYHINLRAESIRTTIEDIEEFKDEVELLHGIGLKLYDIKLTIPQLRNEVERLARINSDVYKAYSEAGIYLQQITIDTPRKDQEDIINSFLTKLGYSKQVFI